MICAISSWGDQLTKYDGVTITYDALGNPLSYYNGNSYTFEWLGRNLTRVENISKDDTHYFDYGEDGKITGAIIDYMYRSYYYDGDLLIAIDAEFTRYSFFYDANGSPVGMQYRLHSYAEGVWDVYRFEKNIHGDIVAIYNSQGTKLISYTYTAYGMFNVTYHNSGYASTATKNRLTYRGYYFDMDLQMYYLNSRYYNQNTCRFISPDDVSYLGANGDLISYNLYAYCSNNPVNFVDPSGRAAVSHILVGFMIAVPFVFAISSIISDLEPTNGEPNIVGSPHDKSDGVNGESFSPYAQYETYEMFGLLYGASFEAGLYTQIFDINESLQANFDLVKADLAVTAFGGGSGVYLAELSLSQTNINILGQNITVSLKGNIGLGAKAQIGKRSVFGFSKGVGFELSVYIN